MSLAILEREHPRLVGSGYELTSPENGLYNCIAWAANDNRKFWWPDPMFRRHWPIARRSVTRTCFIEAFEFIGFAVCEGDVVESEFIKVALYELNGTPTHMARQLPNGKWTSKCGPLEDITHTLRDLETGIYGQVALFMKKPLAKA